MSKGSLSLVFILLVSSLSYMSAQSDKLKALEAKRTQYQKELKQLNALFSLGKKKEKSIVTQVEDVNYKINVQQNLIAITNEQANQLTREINTNQKEISNLREQLKELKEDYASMIVKAYKSKSKQSKLMFLLSSENFKQAYKRLQYINQYKDYQKQQAEEIKAKTQSLQTLNLKLSKQKDDKKKLIAENKITKRELEDQKKAQEALMVLIKKDLKKHTAEIKKKRQQTELIDREIDRLIKVAIASSNKKAGKKSSSGKFVLTPEAKRLASNFEANKGKLGWPVTRGAIKSGFGKQRSSIDKTIFVNNSGIKIATEKNADVKAVFNGEVYRIFVVKNGNPGIMIKHGDYITIYYNLSKITTEVGDKVKTGETIGKVFTNKISGESLLDFRLFKNDKKLNPSYWLAKN